MSAPAGCSLAGFVATCSYLTWSPPLLDSQFSTSPGEVILNDVAGTIPSGAFSGLENSGGYTGSPQISLDCGWGNTNTMTLLSDSLSSNLSWVEQMMITDCYDMQIESGAFSALTNMTLLTVMAGNISSISSSAFSGLSSLTTLYFYAGFPLSGVPSGLFDGLTGLTTLDMSRTALYSLPADLFKDQLYLSSLQLLSSNLTTLPSDIFYPLLSLSTLDIGDNSWTCDCQLEWLGTYLTDTGLAIANCSTPDVYSGFDLSAVVRSLDCTSTTVAVTSADDDDTWKYGLMAGTSLAFILSIIALICVAYTRYKLKKVRKEASRLRKEQKGHDNPSYKKENAVMSLTDVGNTRSNASPYSKRAKQVAPKQVWTPQRDLDEF